MKIEKEKRIGKCSNCGEEKYILNIARQLCEQCYGKMYRENKLKPYVKKYQSAYSYQPKSVQREIEFTKNFFDHSDWEYHPATFRLKNGEAYTPDFFDRKRGIFIEVCSTPERFKATEERYRLFVESYPGIKYEERNVNGDLLKRKT